MPSCSRAGTAFERRGGLVELGVTKQVGVDRGGDVRVGVSELPGDDDQGHAPRQHHARARVPKAVRRHQGSWLAVLIVRNQTGTQQRSLERSGE